MKLRKYGNMEIINQISFWDLHLDKITSEIQLHDSLKISMPILWGQKFWSVIDQTTQFSNNILFAFPGKVVWDRKIMAEFSALLKVF